MMIAETVDHRLSDAQLAKIAKLALHWSAAELCLIRSLALVMKVDVDVARHLIDRRSFTDVVVIFEQWRKSGQLDDRFAAPLAELQACMQHRSARNAYAHGVFGLSEKGKGFAFTASGGRADLAQLDRDFEWAKYVSHVAMMILALATGNEAGMELPSRPPS